MPYLDLVISLNETIQVDSNDSYLVAAKRFSRPEAERDSEATKW